MNTAHLVLSDGGLYPGRWFGSRPPAPEDLRAPADFPAKLPSGEVIFNTGMCGYHEILTDPSYYGQIVVMTYPHIGNYGTDEEWTEYGSLVGERAERLKSSALVVRSLYGGPVPHGRVSLDDFLKSYGTTGLTEVDTRRLTLRLRDEGAVNGVIVHTPDGELSAEQQQLCLDYLAEFPAMEGRDLVTEIGLDEVVTTGAANGPHIVLVDCGVKAGIVRELTDLGCRVSLVPHSFEPQRILELHPDAVLYSNGPGDPAVLGAMVEQIRGLLGTAPVLGICLGHQLISQALGARTYKLKFGHHGVNNPVRDELTGRVYITSQNHGFAVREETLPGTTKVWFRNANDGTNEGIVDAERGVWSVQFHPESAPGPRDSTWIFRRFLEAAGQTEATHARS